MSTFKYRTNRRLYRSRNGVILGVCKGLADYFNLNVFWLRIIAVLILILSGLWPVVGLYLLASLLMKPEPVRPFKTDEERDFYDSYVHSRQNAARRVRRRYENLDRRIRRMEDTVTAREFDWDRKRKA
jgi:phage shock protein C